MITTYNIVTPPELKASTEQYLQSDPAAKQIAEIEESIKNKKNEVYDLESELITIKKKRPEVRIEYRKSIMWCLEIDWKHPFYFLKNKESLVNCVQYKYKIKLSSPQNNAFGSVLSSLFKESKIGRVKHLGVYYYGLTCMFEKDEKGYFTILKDEYEAGIDNLHQVNL